MSDHQTEEVPQHKNYGLVASLVAVAGTEAFSGFYDNLLYPISIAKFGPLYGGVSVSVAAIIINFLMVVWYRRTKTDWYSFEAVREEELKEMGEGKSKSRKGKWITFITLSVQDPFLAFVFMEGRKGTISMDFRDWMVFALANAIGIGIWLFLLVLVFATGGLVSERVAEWSMYALGGYGLCRIIWGLYKHKIAKKS